MIAQSIRSVSVNTNSLKTSNGKKEVQSFLFDTFISNNLKNNDNTEKQISNKSQEMLTASKKNLDEDRCIQKSSGRFDKRKNIKNQTKTSEMSNNITKSTNVEHETVKALKELEDTVKKELKLSDEELQEAMEALGFTVIDLLNVENLKRLCLQVHGAKDITDVLTNENLANEMDALLQAVKELQDSKGTLLNEEQVKNLLNSVGAKDLMNQEEMQKVTKADPIESSSEKILNISMESESQEVVPDKQNAVEAVIGKDENVSTLENTQEEEVIISVSSDNPNGEESKLNSNNSNLLDENTMQDDSIEELSDGQSDQNEPKFEPLNDMNSFIHNLASATLGKEYIGAEQTRDVTMIRNIASQIIEQLKVSVKPDFTSMELQLNPEHLGKVGLSIVSKDGTMTAQFMAQNEMAKEAIESQMHVLIENLNNQGLKVESIEVAVSNFTFGESNQAFKGNEQQRNSQNSNHFRSDEDILGNLEGVSGTTDIPSDNPELNGSIIDYSA